MSGFRKWENLAMHFLLASWSQIWSVGSQANQQGFTWLKLNVRGLTYQLLFWWSSSLVRFRYQGFCLYIVIPFILPRLPDNSPISFHFFKLAVDTKILWYKRWRVLTRNCWLLYSSTVQVPELCSIQIPRKSISHARHTREADSIERTAKLRKLNNIS